MTRTLQRRFAPLEVSDHVSTSNILSIPSVEITHAPAPGIPKIAKKARAMGAVEVVHREITVEPVEHGTNQHAVESEEVEILAHRGPITVEVAERAAEHGIALELFRAGGTGRPIPNWPKQRGRLERCSWSGATSTSRRTS